MIIKFFPLRTKITDIHAQLGLEMVNSRTEKLFHKFLLTRLNNELIQEEFSKYLDELPAEPQPKLPHDFRPNENLFRNKLTQIN